MRPMGRRSRVALVGLLGAMALLPGVPAESAETNRTEIEISTRGIDTGETALGDLVADAIRMSAKADVAFIPAAAFTEMPLTITVGPFTIARLMQALEYKIESIVLVKLTGEQIRAALEHGLSLYPKANPSFLQMSGLTVTARQGGESDKHVVSIKIGGDPLVAGKTYKVAMPLTLANGALAYFKYWKKSDMEKDTDTTLERALTSYLADHDTITKGDERLVAKNK
jgi:5'-nucleotidase / UDP-sugar diphosphatase